MIANVPLHRDIIAAWEERRSRPVEWRCGIQRFMNAPTRGPAEPENNE
jgi:hypothetical protein